MITQLTQKVLILILMLLATPISAGDYRIETVASGLEHPWSLAFLPDGRMLVTERAGRLRVIENGQLLAAPVEGVPDSLVRKQGGLLEVLPHPDFERHPYLFLTQSVGAPRANATRLIRGRLKANTLTDVEILFEAAPRRSRPLHYGGRMTFLEDGTLVLGLGDGYDHREDAQRLDSHTGTIVRLNPEDGSVPTDNPFVDRDDALPEIYSYGHRNVQGLVWDAQTGILWSHEHGPRGGDELNIIEPGANYGWPAATHGIDYSGAIISPHTSLPGMEDPVHQWTPSIAPAGMTLYRGDRFPQWQGSLFVTSLVEHHVRRLTLDGVQVVDEEILFEEVGERIRDVRTGPDGALYLLTDKADGRVLRVDAPPAR
ncbi:PQQ-dependent sugar dehydrogenase [Ectothiorhodospira marina]|uniref:Glucose/arabinose dehydrogenase, beta-propeller fold n=1 Tax=Ectothiorhodospira marina TaxID=1396821 RepID=A0A1H7KXG6_9GAMM|nr:PQQ-dependent sugar dehydrogenase [Ectothiorhodospira marina]SEK91230.1 Glucose/arabinose dehydrogenase, beta-propeller fold [Ectothiorhodospira marina]